MGILVEMVKSIESLQLDIKVITRVGKYYKFYC